MNTTTLKISAGMLNISISGTTNMESLPMLTPVAKAFGDGAQTGIDIELTNPLGQIVLNKKTNRKHSSFNISHLAKGVYFVTMKQNQFEKTMKIIKG